MVPIERKVINRAICLQPHGEKTDYEINGKNCRVEPRIFISKIG